MFPPNDKLTAAIAERRERQANEKAELNNLFLCEIIHTATVKKGINRTGYYGCAHSNTVEILDSVTSYKFKRYFPKKFQQLNRKSALSCIDEYGEYAKYISRKFWQKRIIESAMENRLNEVIKIADGKLYYIPGPVSEYEPSEALSEEQLQRFLLGEVFRDDLFLAPGERLLRNLHYHNNQSALDDCYKIHMHCNTNLCSELTDQSGELVAAVRCHQLSSVSRLINDEDNYSQPKLHEAFALALSSGMIDIAKIILNKHPELARYKPSSNEEPFVVAAVRSENRSATLALMLEHGATITKIDCRGNHLLTYLADEICNETLFEDGAQWLTETLLPTNKADIELLIERACINGYPAILEQLASNITSNKMQFEIDIITFIEADWFHNDDPSLHRGMQSLFSCLLSLYEFNNGTAEFEQITTFCLKQPKFTAYNQSDMLIAINNFIVDATPPPLSNPIAEPSDGCQAQDQDETINTQKQAALMLFKLLTGAIQHSEFKPHIAALRQTPLWEIYNNHVTESFSKTASLAEATANSLWHVIDAITRGNVDTSSDDVKRQSASEPAQSIKPAQSDKRELIIALDIDGVMIPYSKSDHDTRDYERLVGVRRKLVREFKQESIDSLNELIAYARAMGLDPKIVISSSWRIKNHPKPSLLFNAEELTKLFTVDGNPLFDAEIIGCTHFINPLHRGFEIALKLKEYGDDVLAVIFDDYPVGQSLEAIFVQTDSENCLTRDLVPFAIAKIMDQIIYQTDTKHANCTIPAPPSMTSSG